MTAIDNLWWGKPKETKKKKNKLTEEMKTRFFFGFAHP